jgi:hypothetical protein
LEEVKWIIFIQKILDSLNLVLVLRVVA